MERLPMTTGRSDDDEMDLINAEFDQSAPTTFLDELDAIHAADSDAEIYANPPRVKRNFHQRIEELMKSVKRWWNRNDIDGDGAVL
jgi:hypothetical protein